MNAPLGGNGCSRVSHVGVRPASHMPYAGQEERTVKTLSDEERRALLNGQGMGLAKAAELNHYPGPRHVLDLAAPLQLSDRNAPTPRRSMIACTRKRCASAPSSSTGSRHWIGYSRRGRECGELDTWPDIAQLRGDLRVVHLQAHVEMKGVLSASRSTVRCATGVYRADRTSRPQGNISTVIKWCTPNSGGCKHMIATGVDK